MIQESRVQEQPRTTEVRRVETHERGAADYRPVGLARVAWGAVIAGTVAVIAAQVIFATLGLAIGLSIPGTAATAEGMGIFAGIWWLITGIIALFIGGVVAGRYAGIGQEMDAGLHGVMTWALATTLSVLFVTTFGGILAGGALGAMADDIAPQAMQQPADPAMGGAGTGIPETTTTTDEIQGTAAGAAWWAFFALLLGLIAAGVGGYIATPRDTSGTTYSTGTTGGVHGRTAPSSA